MPKQNTFYVAKRPKPKVVNCCWITNIIADEPTRLTLSIISLMAMLRLEFIKENIAIMASNMIRHSKDCKKHNDN